jgi:Photosystem II Pbs27
VSLERKLIPALKSSIQKELDGSSESEVCIMLDWQRSTARGWLYLKILGNVFELAMAATSSECISCIHDGRVPFQVRRAAEDAKGAIRDFIGKWKYDGRVQKSQIFTETSQALEELGQYYLRRGQRAALDNSTASSILAHLDKAETLLPAEQQKKILGLF